MLSSCAAMTRARAAVAGAGAAIVWAASEPLVRRLLQTSYSDVRLVGFPRHVANGALFGLAYGELRRRRDVPAVAAAMVEHVALWPVLGLFDRAALRSPRAFASSGVCHLIFGAALG